VEFIEDRPLEYERLRKSGELEKLKLTIGLAPVILIIWALIKV